MTQNNSDSKRGPLGNLIAGVAGGASSTAVLHPIDLVKVRFQVQHRYRVGTGNAESQAMTSIAGAVRHIYKHDGLPGFFRGVVPAMWGSTLSWGLYFHWYESNRNWFRRFNGDVVDETALPAWQTALSALAASMTTVFFTNPIWVVKTQLQLQSTQPELTPYRGMVDAFRSIYRTQGIRGLYRGLVPALFLTSHGMIQFSAYEEMKKYLPEPSSPAYLSLYHFGLAASSKVVASTVTYPYQVLKSRLQARNSPYTGVLHALSSTMRNEGVRALFGGYTANLIRVVPGSAITITIYELIKPLTSKF